MSKSENIPPPFTVEELRNMDLSDVDPTPPNKIYDELVQVLGEKHRDPARNASSGPSNVQPRTTVESDESSDDNKSGQTSPAIVEGLHPGYPYRDNLGENDDLVECIYP
jgi:hypothetical protein